jgi:hypothetical protein
MDFVIGNPPFPFLFDAVEAFGLAGLSGRRAGFDTDDIGRIQGIGSFFEFTLGTELDDFIGNFLSGHKNLLCGFCFCYETIDAESWPGASSKYGFRTAVRLVFTPR